ncbi:MAG TPA: hypothetical protein VHB79_06675 [Polyangiaceae bacterium]|nr:hypothetical protein [Polyangiaceae bacterium]
MKRLLDSERAAEPQLERLARWLERVEPIADDAARRRRVRLAMQQSGRGGWRLGRGALAVVLLVAGVAGAAGHQLLRPARPAREEAPPVAPTPAAVVPARSTATTQPIAAANDTAAATPLPSVAAAPLASAFASARVVAPRGARRLAAAAPSGDDPGTRLMVEAMQARSAGRYSRALALLSDYQRRFPGGALQDEALALQVEMSSLQGSNERSRALGRAYLARFPNGRYRAWVTQSLAAAEP